MKAVKASGKTIYIIDNPDLIVKIDALIAEAEGTVTTLDDGGGHPQKPPTGGGGQ